MIDFLLGVPGKLKTISDYLTTNLAAVRTAKIDQLDASVSSRASASTALSNATWTNGRAAQLDLIAAPTGAIQSIQTGMASSITTIGGTLTSKIDITVSAVVVAKTIVFTQNASQTTTPLQLAGYMSSTTNLRLETNDAVGSQASCRWYVVEFK